KGSRRPSQASRPAPRWRADLLARVPPRFGPRAWWRCIYTFCEDQAMAARSDEAARQRVLSSLRDPAVRPLAYRLGSFVIAATDYERVARAIDNNRIHVVDDPTFNGNAVYDSGPNRITISASSASSALIVHEATHAVQDARR